MRILDGLSLVNKLDDDLKKCQVSDVLKVEEDISYNLDKKVAFISIGNKNKVGLVSLINTKKTIATIVKKWNLHDSCR